MRVLAERSQCLVASPALLQRLGTPQVPADLARLPSLDLGVPQHEHVWHLLGPDGAHGDGPPSAAPGHARHAGAARRRGGRRRRGAIADDDGARRNLRAANWCACCPDWAPRREIVHAVFASRRGLLPSVRALIDFLADGFARLHED